MQLDISADILDKITALLKERGCLSAEIIREKLGYSWRDVINALMDGERRNLFERREPLDITKPVETALWCLKAEEHEKDVETQQQCGWGYIESLILTPPLIYDLRRLPPGYIGLMDFLKNYFCGAKKELRIMVPYLERLLEYAFSNCLREVSDLKIRIITEEEENNLRTIELAKKFLKQLEVRFVTKVINGRKYKGTHAKLFIIDNEVAVIGTFNITRAHLLVDYDLGVAIRGPLVNYLIDIFDQIWNITDNEI